MNLFLWDWLETLYRPRSFSRFLYVFLFRSLFVRGEQKRYQILTASEPKLQLIKFSFYCFCLLTKKSYFGLTSIESSCSTFQGRWQLSSDNKNEEGKPKQLKAQQLSHRHEINYRRYFGKGNELERVEKVFSWNLSTMILLKKNFSSNLYETKKF